MQAFGLQSNLSIGTLLSAPFPRSEACRANGNSMRTLVEPPPSLHRNQCGGELRLQQIERANDTLDLDIQILVCAECGREHSCTCLLYTSDAADEEDSVDLGGRRIIKKKKKKIKKKQN